MEQTQSDRETEKGKESVRQTERKGGGIEKLRNERRKLQTGERWEVGHGVIKC